MEQATLSDRWHELLTSRYICEACLTRFFRSYRTCPACHQSDRIRPFLSLLFSVAISDDELRAMVAQGQRVVPADAPEPQVGIADEPASDVPVDFNEYLPNSAPDPTPARPGEEDFTI